MATDPAPATTAGEVAPPGCRRACFTWYILPILVAIGAFVIYVTFFDDGGGSLPNRTITAAEFGDRWPFTVASGELYCTGANVVTFVAAGDTYAVNGAATQAGRGMDIGPIWAADTSSGGTKKSIAPIIDAGLALCK